MSIRAKFFALAGILLLLFGAVVGLLTLLQDATAHKLADIVYHHQPLRRALADLDVDTFEYELRIDRLLLRSDISKVELQAEVANIEQVAARIRKNFDALRPSLEAAVAHNHGNPDDLYVLSTMQGALPFIDRQVEPFLALGRQVIDALLAARLDEARTLALGFARYNEAFDPDLGQLRQHLATLTEKAATGIYQEQNLDIWLSFTLFLLATVIGLAISAFNRMIEELRERERIKETFGKFVDPRIVTSIISSTATEQAERKILTVFFSDIKDFSSISEQLTAASMVNLLNAYFTAIADEIRRYNGIIDKYIGDSVMAFWCAPFSAGDEHALDSCKAAQAQVQAMAEVKRRLLEIIGLRRDTPELVVRMGIATGEAVVGTIGSPSARSYTVIGDTVNLASRLEGVNKVYDTSIILAEDTYRLARHAIEVRELDVVTVVGKSEPIRIYELLAEAGGLDVTRAELRETFAQGLDAYRRQNWETATAQFEMCRCLAPDDGPSRVYLERIAHLRCNPPPPEWDGVWRLAAK